MALEAVVYQQDLFGHSTKEFYNLLGGNWSYEFGQLEKEDHHDYNKAAGCFENFLDNQTENGLHGDWNNSSSSPPSIMPHLSEMLQINPSSEPNNDSNQLLESPSTMPARAKRRRSRSRKNKEEIENQRMTHIAVERNRRKQMNEYLSVLRSLMPDSYVQRGDQASIIGGAINFVKELEQRLQLLGGEKQVKEEKSQGEECPLPFSDFFTFPQYSTTRSDSSVTGVNETMSATTESSIADIEVTMVESHANVKIRSKRRPKQLLKIVSGLHSMRLTILHLNVTTLDQIVLYSLSVKVEDDCNLSSVDEIATAVYEMLGRIQEEYSVM
ncbi:hypothetical protein JCGZ_23378 [Jatropha curcas]|uniref:BHLH domain-containing protein n=1 Tax=Jatropha curcas TaxID=180498 RepID=A0A067JU77_JATCU|nr:transcription factor bHLH94 [Jatropha curcas]KDP23545.1 hypothetical protein JCGZ_23378 [Jatropha curcas]